MLKEISDVLIASGPITYIGIWVIVLLILIFLDLPDSVQHGLIIYAAVPIGSVCQTCAGWLLSLI